MTEAEDGEPYVRASGDVCCEICGKKYYDHPRVRTHDSFDGQEMDLVRVCNGQLYKL